MNFDRARRYLELFNVRDLIVRSREAKEAIRQVSGYAMTKIIGHYELWQLTENSGRYVEVLENEPVRYSGNESWKVIAHQWFTRDDLQDVHLVFPGNGAENLDNPVRLAADDLDDLPRSGLDSADCSLKESISNEEILLETSCPGKPHLVKVSYHPNWHVEGAEKILLVSPSFMLIYPQQEKVRLYYGPGTWDRLGQLLTIFGLLVLLLNVPLPGRQGQSVWSVVAKRLRLPAGQDLRFLPDPGPGTRQITMLLLFGAAAVLVGAGAYNTYVNEPYRLYNQSIRFKDAGRYDEARAGFRSFMQTYPLANLAQEASYYTGITYYLEQKDEESLAAFKDYIKRYPDGSRAAEVHYHIGLVLLRSGRKAEGLARMKLLTQQYPGSPWAGYAMERLQEHSDKPKGVKIDINRANLNQVMGQAISYFNQDRLEEAKPILLEISQRFPDYAGAPQALAALALCFYKEDDCANTIRYYQELVERYPGHRLAAEAYFHLGLCFDRTGNPERAAEAYRKVLEIDADGVYGSQAGARLNQ